MSRLNIGCLYRRVNDLNDTAYFHANGIILAEAFYNPFHSRIFIYFNETYFKKEKEEIEINGNYDKNNGTGVIYKFNKKVRKVIDSNITTKIKKEILKTIPYEEFKHYNKIIEMPV